MGCLFPVSLGLCETVRHQVVDSAVAYLTAVGEQREKQEGLESQDVFQGYFPNDLSSSHWVRPPKNYSPVDRRREPHQ